MKIFIANFGSRNWYWDRCKERSVIMVIDDARLVPLWLRGNKEEYKQVALNICSGSESKPLSKQTAAIWYNINEIFRNTHDDIWLHRDGNSLWWTISSNEPLIIESGLNPSPRLPDGAESFIMLKPCMEWQDENIAGIKIAWSDLSNNAKNLLDLRGVTVRSVNNLIYDEIKNLLSINSIPIDDIKAKIQTHDPWSASISRMVETTLDTVKASNSTANVVFKNKEFLFNSKDEAKKYIHDIIIKQNGLCNLSKIPLEFEEASISEFSCSLDRINSDRNYEKNNLQVVCKFINRWKSDMDNESFKKLLESVVSASIKK